MKLALVFLIFTALLVLALGEGPTPARRCDYKCTQLDGHVCGSNGKCIHKFPSICQMDKYNCLFPRKAFRMIEDWKCNESSMPLCAVSDL